MISCLREIKSKLTLKFEDMNQSKSIRKYQPTRSSGPYGPLLLAPAEGIGGPFGPSLGALRAPTTSQNSINRWLRKVGPKNWQKSSKIVFLMHFVTTSENVRQNPKPFLESFFLVVFKNGIEKHSTWEYDWENCIWSEAIKTAKNCKKCLY